MSPDDRDTTPAPPGGVDPDVLDAIADDLEDLDRRSRRGGPQPRQHPQRLATRGRGGAGVEVAD